MLFKRKTYLQQLISAEGNGMIKVITGIRRCGKQLGADIPLERHVPIAHRSIPGHLHLQKWIPSG